jgi:hypothetical protein
MLFDITGERTGFVSVQDSMRLMSDVHMPAKINNKK